MNTISLSIGSLKRIYSLKLTRYPVYMFNTNGSSTMMNCYEKRRENNEIFFDNQLLISCFFFFFFSFFLYQSLYDYKYILTQAINKRMSIDLKQKTQEKNKSFFFMIIIICQNNQS